MYVLCQVPHCRMRPKVLWVLFSEAGDRVSEAAMLDMSSGDAKLKFTGAAVTDEAGGLEVTRDWG